MPGCQTQTLTSSSLVSFLYPNGQDLPSANTIPELRIPLRVGLAFLPSSQSYGAPQLDASHKLDLLEQIRARFVDRKFISEIVLIPDSYLDSKRGYAGLEGVQRLYKVDLMALASYDQVTHKTDNKLSLGYLTIIGAYIFKGSTHDVATLLDLAVVDPVTRSLVLRAGGTDAHHGKSTLIDEQRDSRLAASKSLDAAAAQLISNFNTALTDFEADVRAGKASVRIVKRDGSTGSESGGGSIGIASILALAAMVVVLRKAIPG
jgi:rhombotail lipoprotein